MWVLWSDKIVERVRNDLEALVTALFQAPYGLHPLRKLTPERRLRVGSRHTIAICCAAARNHQPGPDDGLGSEADIHKHRNSNPSGIDFLRLSVPPVSQTAGTGAA